jgi:hypothetical protein
MATLLASVMVKMNQNELVPIAIVVGFVLDALILYNLLKVGV